ncbi:MAG: tRNA dihydrouridine(20/20a) synthase DusA [Burkholderiaceae bacterium]|jgi:tRNA-dihydrouridine synthase A
MRFPRRISIAPMLDWTDRHCRRFHRELTHHAWLYSEMVTTGALIHGNAARFLQKDPLEQPVAFQIGGSDPADLARCAKMVEAAGYDEVNLNCGCPSERVQRGAFGACLMAEPGLVADGVKAMKDTVDIEVTVKNRIGLNDDTSENLLHEFIGRVAEAGCHTFIVHARNAVLRGLSPKENREIPPLRYDVVYRLKQLFPALEIILNGGVKCSADVHRHLSHLDGVMIGREAYHNPWLLNEVDAVFAQSTAPGRKREDVLQALRPYVEKELRASTPLRQITKSWLGLYHGQPGGRLFRRTLSEPHELLTNDWRVIERALAWTRA